MENTTKFDNFVAITCTVSDIESKEAKSSGKPYATANAVVDMGKGIPMPMRVVALGAISTVLKEGTFTLLGRLGYEEYEKRDGSKGSSYVIYPTRIEAAPADGKARNYASLTLRVGQDPDSRFTEGGKMWSKVRAALGMGKDKSTGEYKPSLWMTVKGFTSKEGDETLPNTLANLCKGEQVTIAGHFAYELYQGKGYLNLVAMKVEPIRVTETVDEDAIPD
jgi:single-stranded DNA-binding protein